MRLKVKRFIKWLVAVGLSPFALVLILSILLYIPFIQDWAVHKATSYLSQTTGLKISIDKLRLTLPLNISAKDVIIIDSLDTIAGIKCLDASIKFFPLFHKEIKSDALTFHNTCFNTGSILEGMIVRGFVRKLKACSNSFHFDTDKIRLEDVFASGGNVYLLMKDTVIPPDTSRTDYFIALKKVHVRNVAYAMDMPADSLHLNSFIGKADLYDGILDLYNSKYSAQKVVIKNSMVSYNGNSQKAMSGLDPMHVQLNKLNLEVDSLSYSEAFMCANICSGDAVERSGLIISSITGSLTNDSTLLNVPQLHLTTPNSDFRLLCYCPWLALNETNPKGNIRALLRASVGRSDIMTLLGLKSKALEKLYPNKDFEIVAGLEGNSKKLLIRQFKGELPGTLHANITGEIHDMMDSVRRGGNVQMKVSTGNINFMLAMLSKENRSRYRLPVGMSLVADASMENGAYKANCLFKESRGTIRFNGNYKSLLNSYKADLVIDSLQPNHFMPHDSLYWVNASLTAEGRGTDVFRASTFANLQGTIKNVRYGSRSISGIQFDGSLKKCNLLLNLISDYPYARMNASLQALLNRKKTTASLTADVGMLDFNGLQFTEDTIMTSFHLTAKLETDMKRNNHLDMVMGDWVIDMPSGKFNPKDITLHANTTRDTTRMVLQAGDLALTLTGNSDLETMMNRFSRIGEHLSGEMKKDSTIHLSHFRNLLPDMKLSLTAARDNPLYTFMDQYNIGFNSLHFEATTSPKEGFNMDGGLYVLMRDTSRYDTIRVVVRQDSVGLLYNAALIKKPYRQQTSFTATVSGKVRDDFADALFRYADGTGKTGVLLGVRAEMAKEGFRFHVFPDNPILAYRDFTINNDNEIWFKSKKDISANLRLKGEKNMSLWLHSVPETGKMDELHAELNQIDLKMWTSGFVGMPNLGGILNADIQYAPTDSAFMVVVDANVDTLKYNEGKVGEIMLNAVYLPLGNNSHQVDLHLFHDRQEVGAITALYRPGKKTDYIEGSMQLTSLPLAMFNPFIPGNMASLHGSMQGDMTIRGTSDNPLANGFLKMDTSSVYVASLGSSFRVDEDKIDVKNNQILFDKYHIHSSAGKTPFVIDGLIDCRNLEKMTADLKLTANQMQVLDAKRTRESLIYGKLIANLNSTLKGPLNALTMRGDLKILGGTDVTYVMQESPLTVQDRLTGLVTFTDFTDTTGMSRRRGTYNAVPVTGIDMLMTIHLDQSVRINADITPDRSSRIELEGGGNLSFQYTRQGEMLMNGRYTLSGGMVKYAMPVIPLKEFDIHEGSYVQWNGDVMEPVLNLTATERMRSTVTSNGTSRMVNFDVGVSIKNTLDNMKLQFILSAPEDQTLQSELTAMGEEERAKQAVTMLVTGLYLAGNGTKTNLNMGAALNSFLQSEINTIAGSALKTVDITFGMDSYDTDASNASSMRTDYSFRFSKRFLNDRVRVVLGGRISTGENVNKGQSQAFIDDVSVEYRLDPTGTRYVRVFHDKNYESLLEGEVTETGVGIILRRKMNRLREMFIFKRNKMTPTSEERTNETEEKE